MAASEVVIREVTKGVWTFSKPFARFGWMPIGGRSTAVQLSSGDVWVLVSTPLTTETKETIDKIGPVKYIVAPDAVHHLYLGEFRKSYPTAKVIGVEPLIAKKEPEGIHFTGTYGKDPEGTKYGFEPEIQACYFSGFENKDVAFLHGPSKTLIQADLLFNLPPKEQYSKSQSWSTIPIFSSIIKLNPWSSTHAKLVWKLGTDKEAMKKDVKTVASWDFNRIIPCHGDVIEGNGKDAWTTLYKGYLGTS